MPIRVVRGSVDGGRREEAHVVRLVQIAHKIVDEPRGGESSCAPVLERHDHEEPAPGFCQATALLQSLYGSANTLPRRSCELLEFATGHGVDPVLLELVDLIR